MNSIEDIKANWIKTTSDGIDTQIEAWINIATEHVEKICRQAILKRDVDLIYVGHGRQIKLAHATVPIDVKDVAFRARPIDDWTVQTTLDVAQFDVEGVWYLYREAGFSSSYMWKVTVEAGWAIADIPALIKAVHGEMVYTLFRESPYASDQRILGVSQVSKTQGGVTTTTSFADLIPRWTMLLEPYTVVTA